eukprot:augustus_masked-scaffold_52-processed-gene-1.17-mRNA-1 protein AED:1.00 eAED:1.00 QI:0/-1/0/0/-1/1/1/0/1082
MSVEIIEAISLIKTTWSNKDKAVLEKVKNEQDEIVMSMERIKVLQKEFSEEDKFPDLNSYDGNSHEEFCIQLEEREKKKQNLKVSLFALISSLLISKYENMDFMNDFFCEEQSFFEYMISVCENSDEQQKNLENEVEEKRVFLEEQKKVNVNLNEQVEIWKNKYEEERRNNFEVKEESEKLKKEFEETRESFFLSLEGEKSDKEKLVFELRDKLKAMEEKNKKLQNDLQNEKNEKETVFEELRIQKDDNKSKDELITKQNTENERLISENKKKQRDISELENRLSFSEVDNETLGMEKQSLEDDLKEKKESLEEKIELITSLKTELSETKASENNLSILLDDEKAKNSLLENISAEVQDKLNISEEKLDEEKMEKSKFKELSKTLQFKLNNLEDSLKLTKEHVASGDSRLQRLFEEREQIAKHSREQAEEITSLKSTLVSTEQELYSANKNVESTREQNFAFTEEIKKLENQNEKLDCNLKSANEKIMQLRESVKKGELMEKDLKESKELLERVSKEKEEYRLLSERLTEELAVRNENIIELTEKLEQIKVANDGLENRLKSTQKESDAAVEKNENLMAEIIAFEKDNQSLQQELTKQAAESREKNENLSKNQEYINTLEINVEELSKNLQETSAILSEKSTELTSTCLELEETKIELKEKFDYLAKLNAEIDGLKKVKTENEKISLDLQSETEKYSVLLKQKTELEDILQNTLLERDQIQEELERKCTELNEKIELNNSFLKERKKLEDRIQELRIIEVEKKSLQDQSVFLKEKVESLGFKLNKFTQDLVSPLQKELDVKEEELRDTVSLVQKLQQNIDFLSTKNQTLEKNRDSLMMKLASLEEVKNQVEELLASESAKVQSNDTDLKALKKDVERKEMLLKQAESRVEKLRNQRNVWNSEQSKTSKSFGDSKGEILRLTQELKSVSRENLRLKNKNSQLVDKCSYLQRTGKKNVNIETESIFPEGEKRLKEQIVILEGEKQELSLANGIEIAKRMSAEQEKIMLENKITLVEQRNERLKLSCDRWKTKFQMMEKENIRKGDVYNSPGKMLVTKHVPVPQSGQKIVKKEQEEDKPGDCKQQ